jgi:hypothetical protein
MIYRRLLAIIFALISVYATAQTTGGMSGIGGLRGAGGGCSQATAFLARATGANAAHQTNYTNLICGLVTDGTFAKLDVLYVFVTNSTTNAVLNLIQNSFNGTVTGTLTFTADTGWTGDGSTGFINSGFNASTAGGNYSQNAASLGVCDLTSGTTQSNVNRPIGINDNQSFIIPLAQFAGGSATYGVNSTAPPTPANANTQGLWIATRTSSSAISLYKNGTSFDSSSDTSVALANRNFYVFATNNAGTANDFTADQLGAALFGALSATDIANVYARLHTYFGAYSVTGC